MTIAKTKHPIVIPMRWATDLYICNRGIEKLIDKANSQHEINRLKKIMNANSLIIKQY